jgi:uncharacterized protein (TIGR03118 family)
MSRTHLYLALSAIVIAVPLARNTAGASGNDLQTTNARNDRNDPRGKVVVLETDLVADIPGLLDRHGIVHSAFVLDPHLVNPWGVAESQGSPFWVADNDAGASTLYSVPGAGNTQVSVTPRVFSIPSPGDPLSRSGTPTGAVFNTDSVGQGFKVAGVDRSNNAAAASALFLFASEDGTIVGWNPNVNPPGFDPSLAGTYGIIAVDNSAKPTADEGAVYKGLAIATDAHGETFLYTTNFRAGTVEVYDASFNRVRLPRSAFADPHLPHGYAPFNIALIDGKLFVTYAKQDREKHDDVARPGHGVVDVFDLRGHMLSRFTQHGHLNSPWGMVQAPASFGEFAGAILIGNFGDGRIHAFHPDNGRFLGTVTNSLGQSILIDGLWSLSVGNGTNGGEAGTIYFTAGPNGEKDGLFGSLSPVALGTPCGIPCR